MPSGTVDFYNADGKYGFIVTEASDEDVFFHMDTDKSLDIGEGEDVEFEITAGEKGPRAVNLKPSRAR